MPKPFSYYLLLSLSIFVLNLEAETELTDIQQSLINSLPPDQRESVLTKMRQAEQLQDEIEEGFEDFETLTKRPEAIILSPAEKEAYLKKSRDWIYGYELFQSSPTTFAPATNIPVPSTYTLGPGDQLNISYYGTENKNIDTFVSRTGSMNLPLLGPITVAGLTFSEAEKLINKRVETELIGTKVYLSLNELRSISVYVLGEAYRPGTYTISSLSTLTNLLFVSGGVSKTGSVRNIQVTRDGKVIKNFDLYNLLLKGDTAGDINLQQGDTVFIPLVKNKARVEGSFRRPHLYELVDGDTVEDLAFYAGGLSAESDLSNISLSRINSERNNREYSTFSLTKEKDLKIKIKDGDVVSAREISALSSGLIMLKGQFKYPGVYSFSKEDSLLDLIRRAGGLTKFAYPHGAIFTRESVAKGQEVSFRKTADRLELSIANGIQSGQIGNLVEGNLKHISVLVSRLRSTKPMGRVVVETDPYRLDRDPIQNISLEDGDKLYMPKRPSSIHIIGEVWNPSSHSYNSEYESSDYISLAGGVSTASDEKNIYVILPNGATFKPKRGFLTSGRSLTPGSTIVVPRDARPFDWFILTRELAPILASLSTSAAAIAVLSD
jgi:polysaccharide export outer membrane protein